MSTRVTRSMSASPEQAPMQNMATTRGKLRGGTKSTRGRKSMAAAGQLARVSEEELSAAAGQPVLVGEDGTVRDGALAEDREGTAQGSSSVARPQDGHQDQAKATVVSGFGHPLPTMKMEDGASQPISLPCHSKCPKRSPLLWLTIVLALAAFLLACFALSACSRHHSAKTASSLSEFGNKLQRLTNQTNLLSGRVGQIEERALAAEAPTPSQINWLSWDLGARVINQVSTPAIGIPPILSTVVAKPWWCPWCKRKHIPTHSTSYEQRLFSGAGPNAALLPHREQEPTYCTSSRMQLAVKLPRPIIPTELVIEHWRKDEVPIAGITPRVVELWVEHGEDLAYVGQWIYNVHAIQEAQKFSVVYAGPAIQRVAVRIASNWGNSNMTCLVRAKLHGIDMSGIEETLIEE